ncbi:hypothetical protein [Streptomyces sp. Wb2n-11]|uniref:hypothetical protein n=1 Tax=Streptomyces sp. Wb2n-11 TaxID=1030533 RepID=UPI000AADF644|nr:hypothetical protein [Streptomyces sp. Wb2n-11]
MKRAFVGLSTPLTYDYRNSVGETISGSAVPNAVLENVTGLLLCYDEIWFVSREFCPSDLQELPYVQFVTDFPELWQRALVAREQYGHEDFHAAADLIYEKRPDDYFETVDRIKRSLQFDFRPDNHSRGITPGFGQGNAADARLFIQDLGIAASLDKDLDVITNSTMARALRSLETSGPKVETFEQWQIQAAEEAIAMRTVDYLGPSGAYHESLEDLRGHSQLEEFRNFLAEADRPDADALALASEVNDLAAKHSIDVMERFIKGRGRLRTIGKASVGPVGNLLHPGIGSVLSGAISLSEWNQDRKERKRVAWALFVLQARNLPQRRD